MLRRICERGGSLNYGINAVTGRGYNPSVAPKARQLPLHSWLSSAAGGGYSEKGKPLPSASARANSRSTSGERRGSRESFCKHSVQTLHGGAENALSHRGARRSNYARLWRADLIRHGAAPRRSPAPPSPRGKAKHIVTSVPCTDLPLCVASIKMCRDPRHTLTFAPKGQIFHTRGARISPPRSGDFTRRLAAVFHCGAAAQCAAMGGTH